MSFKNQTLKYVGGENLKKIAFISTGGTISMQADESGLAVPKAGGRELIDSLEDIRSEFNI